MQIYADKQFENPIRIFDVKGEENIKNALNELEILCKKFYALGYITYDFQNLYFELYDSYKKYTPSNPKQLGILTKPLITKEDYVQNIEKIKNYISEGITYEVNYTYPYEVRTNLDDLDLYEALLARQKTPYNTFLKNKYLTLFSFSPELFFKLQGRKILTKPMKGTAPRGLNKEEDAKRRDFLYHDIKNRAENIMIVDLLRNDLGRIAKTGTVKVDKLFEIEEHPTLFQMTSEISAELDDNIRLYDIFKAIFPCGSITGAPKLSTMRVISETEPYNRNIYCGAIGFLSPEETVFSVPIRILQGGEHKFIYNVGGAIVWDSTAEDEWNETVTKMKFLETEFSIIETAVDDWHLHVKRMKKSADELGFKWCKDIETLKLSKDCITRVLLNRDGSYKEDYRPFREIKSGKIKIQGAVNSANPFLYHKTTIRGASPADCFDEIRINERGEITEGTFTNIAVLKDGELFTPPVSSGLLNGVYRQKLIDEGKLKEKILYPEDLRSAEKIFCFNSVRKMVEVCL